jgi:lysozyme
MANNNLKLSSAGIAKLTEHEGSIDGLYDDPKGYCTFGIGHLVHHRDRWECFLLGTASADETWKKYVLKKWSGQKRETPYLTRTAAFVGEFGELKANAIKNAKAAIAQKKYLRRFDKLTLSEQEKVTVAAKEVVDNEAKLLAKSPVEVFTEDIRPFENSVRDKITASLTQEEFDALVSFSFNIGVSAFSHSSVVTEINKDKHKAGTPQDRKAAIKAIETAFAKFNMAGGKVNLGLTKRRKAEADRFLAAARVDLAQLEKKAAASPGSLLAPYSLRRPP